MVSRYSIRKDLKGSYSVTEDFLKNIQELFERTFNTNPRITIKFKNEHEAIYSDINELLRDPSTRSEKIQSITIFSDNYGKDVTAEIDFRDGVISKDVFLYIKGDRDKCILVERNILHEVNSIKSPLSLLYQSAQVEGIIFGLISAVATLIYFDINKIEFETFTFFFMLFGLSIALKMARSALLPKFEFNFGKGQSGVSLRKRAVYFVVVTLLLGGGIAIYQDALVKFANSYFSEAKAEKSTTK